MSGLNAFFGPQLPRLLRGPWTADTLAQELHSMLGSKDPIDVGDGLQFINNSTNPAFTITTPEGPDFNQQISIVQGNSSFSLSIGGITSILNSPFTLIQQYPPGDGGGDPSTPFPIIINNNITIIDDGGEPKPAKQDCPPFIGWVKLEEELYSAEMSSGKLFGWDPVEKAWLPGNDVVQVDGQLFSGHAEAGEDVAVFGDCKRKRLKAIGSSGFTTDSGFPLGFLKSIDDAAVDDECNIVFGYTMLYLHFLKGALISVEEVVVDTEGTEISRTPIPTAGAPVFVDPGPPPYSPGGS